MVPFDMLGIVSYSNIIPKMRCFQTFNFKQCRDLEIRVRGHSRSESGTIRQIRFGFLLVFYSNFVPKRYCRYTVTLKPGLWVT